MADTDIGDLSNRRPREWYVILVISSIAAVASAIFGWFISGANNVRWVSAAQGVASSLMVTVPIVWIETTGMRSRLGRAILRYPFLLFVLAKTVAYLLIIVPSIQIVRWIFSHFSAQTTGLDATFFQSLAFAGALSLSANIILSLGPLLGWPTLWRVLTGRYHQPRREERIFLSIDLRGSTTLAEQLGDTRFHALLSAFFENVTEAASEMNAEIYKYIGDEVILTWQTARGLGRARCLLCPLAVHRQIQANAPSYRARFGTVPRFRAALHIGEVVAGEVGTWRREIGYFGDTLNTTARLAEATKQLDVDVLLSELLLERIAVPPGISIQRLPPLPMRGKSLPLPIAGYSLPA